MIRIAKGLELPVDVVTQPIAILARRGAGKTYTASVIVEEVVRAKVPVVVLDPTGAWWGLRSSVDGERPGLPVVIFGGDHGDVALEPSAGKVIADVVIDHPGAYVVDLSAFESKAAEVRFAADFLERLYRGKRRETGPLLLVVDEADMFAPQQPRDRGDQLRTLGALESIVRRGRIKGLGDLLITQRAAVLNKNVLTQTEVLVVMQTTGPQDRAAIDEWIAGNGTREERDQVLGSLASLERGEAWVWSPSFLRILQRVRIRTRTTFDSSRTPEAGEAAIAPRAFAQVDIAQLDARIAATVEQQKANDPAELKRRIRELERQLAERPAEKVVETVVETVVESVEVPVLTEDDRQMLRDLSLSIHNAAASGLAASDQLGGAIATLIGRVNQTPTREREERAPRGVPAAPARGRGDTAVATLAPAASRRDPASAVDGEGVQLGRAERALLTALVQFPDGLSKARLSLVSGYSSTSSSFSNALGALRSAGLVDRGVSPIRATPAGLEAMPVVPAPPTREERIAFWGGRLGKAERTFLDVLTAAYPDSLTKEEISERTGYSATSSSFSNALGRLRSLELVEGFAASAELME